MEGLLRKGDLQLLFLILTIQKIIPLGILLRGVETFVGQFGLVWVFLLGGFLCFRGVLPSLPTLSHFLFFSRMGHFFFMRPLLLVGEGGMVAQYFIVYLVLRVVVF